MPGSGLGWFDATPPAAPLPYGWTDADVATLSRLAHEFGIDPLEVLALLYSESALNPKASGLGLAGLTSVVETEMGWPHGTITQLNSGPITTYLQAVFQLWAHLQEKYVGKSFVERASQLGITPGATLYVYHGFLGPAMGASGPQSVLGVRPPVWPVTGATGGGWRYNGLPIEQVLGRPLTGKEILYSGNAGLDRGGKGTITVQDMAARVATKAAQLQADPKASAVWKRLVQIETLPSGEVPPLASLFGAVKQAWESLTGKPLRTSSGIVPTEAPHTTGGDSPPTPEPEAPAASSVDSGAAVLLVAGIALAAWHFARQRKGA